VTVAPIPRIKENSTMPKDRKFDRREANRDLFGERAPKARAFTRSLRRKTQQEARRWAVA
jgi:hypothetical protein